MTTQSAINSQLKGETEWHDRYMGEPRHIPALKSLKFVKENGDVFIEFDQLICFLRKCKLESEPDLKSGNILSEFRGHSHAIKEVNGKRLIKASSFLRYVGRHYDKFNICRTVLDEIVSSIFSANHTSEGSVLELYTRITKLKSAVWSEEYLELVDIPISHTLFDDYKDNFSEIEWKKICLFEHHFSKDNKSRSDYEQELTSKEKFLSSIETLLQSCTEISGKCRETTRTQVSRKETSDQINGQTFVKNEIVHSLLKVDQSLNSSIKTFTEFKAQCVTVFCTSEERQNKGDVHIFVETKVENITPDYFENLGLLLQGELLKKHGLNLGYVYFVQSGTFQQFSCKDCDAGDIHRFHLEDAVCKNTVSGIVQRQWKPLDVVCVSDDPKIVEQKSGSKFCECCFSFYADWINCPLDWRSVNVLQEWILHTPVEIQEIFTSCFMNLKCMKLSENKHRFIVERLAKLTALFDTGLSVHNRKYCGILQQLNTEELVVNYHSITTVFDITTNAGATQSLKTADRWLKTTSDVDRSYYNTYIKQYPILYKSLEDFDAEVHKVSLRECIIILFMDNLVRLSTHHDPDPGQNRTSQICTLPITLKGLPKNHALTETWHSDECNETSSKCTCMNRIQFEKKNSDLLLHKTVQESEVWKLFDQQFSISALQCPELDDLLNIKRKETEPSSGLDELDISMNSLTLEEPRDKIINDDNEIISLSDLEGQFNAPITLETSIDEQQFVDNIQDYECLETECTLLCDESESNHSFLSSPKYSLSTFDVPELLCRHPTPATGRDDDISNLKNILQDIVLKLNRKPDQSDRILFAPDHKIAKNLICLMKQDSFFSQFMPEFPALHLRKSKIVNLFSAYKDAGLVHLLKFMKDEEQEEDWMKLITMQNIETATRNVKRLAIALHLAFIVAYFKSLDSESQIAFYNTVVETNSKGSGHKWKQALETFEQFGCSRNATFALHRDLMKHCEEIVAISTAEHVGGPNGYHLLLAAVKSSLPFAFLNGASSYASFCVDLLSEHYSAGPFHQNMKMSLFSTPHKDGQVNIALDTQREMDHRDAIKGFRPRSTLQTVVPRMAIVDYSMDVRKAREHISCVEKQTAESITEISQADSPNVCNIRKKDWRYIIPLVRMITRCSAFETEECLTPKNIYDSKEPDLPIEILDSVSYDVGQFLIQRYAASQGLFGLNEMDTPDPSQLDGPSNLIKKAKTGKGITMRRLKTNYSKDQSNCIGKDEMKRQLDVKKQTKVIDCLSSSMNTCQALVNPDCTKAVVNKSHGIKKALFRALLCTYPSLKLSELEQQLAKDNLMFTTEDVPEIPNTIVCATVEFAGVKFKTKATSGEQYLKHIQNGVLNKILVQFPNVRTVVISEEKYSFTPDNLKSATRKQRQRSHPVSISHLKQGDDILSQHKLSKSAILNTSEGKRLISNYLARNLSALRLRKDVSVIVDSELITVDCECSDSCTCPPYTLPVRAVLGPEGCKEQFVMRDVHQRKGEAELAQIDWLNYFQNNPSDGEAFLSIVTSGDIDSLVIHMFALSLHWPRHPDGKFKIKVYVLLQKVKPELYNITSIIERIEQHFQTKYIAAKLAVVMCMGGNDFIPKMFGIGHEKWVTTVLQMEDVLQSLVVFENGIKCDTPVSGSINVPTYFEVVKQLYCPKVADPRQLTNEEVRQLSIKLPGKEFRHPNNWMPPKTALHSLSNLLNCQIDYMFTAWDATAVLPEFLGRGCLTKEDTGDVKYDFGNQSKTENKMDLLQIDETFLHSKLNQRKQMKRTVPSATPEKRAKRRPMMSTPIKIKKKQSARKVLSTD